MVDLIPLPLCKSICPLPTAHIPVVHKNKVIILLNVIYKPSCCKAFIEVIHIAWLRRQTFYLTLENVTVTKNLGRLLFSSTVLS